jgi:monofunctional chorismate mutase
MEDLASLRKTIDEIDVEMQRLFVARMETVRAIADVKIALDKAVYDREREAAVIAGNVGRLAGSPYEEYYKTFLDAVMQIAKDFQKAIVRSTL